MNAIQFKIIDYVIDKGDNLLVMTFNNIYVNDDRYDICGNHLCICYYWCKADKCSLVDHTVQKAKAGGLKLGSLVFSMDYGPLSSGNKRHKAMDPIISANNLMVAMID